MMCQMLLVLCPLISVLMALTSFLKEMRRWKASGAFLWSLALLYQTAIITLATDTRAKKKKKKKDKTLCKKRKPGFLEYPYKDWGNYLEVIKSTDRRFFFPLSLIHWLLMLMRFVGGLCHTCSDMHRTWQSVRNNRGSSCWLLPVHCVLE